MSSTDPNNSNFEIISAIAKKDASIDDIAKALRDEGVNSMEDVINYLRKSNTAREYAIQSSMRPVDFRRFSVSPNYKARTDMVHKVPSVPILVDSVLYDPADIVRFNGQELHSVLAPDHKSMIAVTDRQVISRWWELNYVSAMMGQSPFALPRAMNNDRSGSSIPRETAGTSSLYRYSPPDPICWYFEHPGRQGSWITHPANRGFGDLTAVHSGFAGWGDSWNDRISCVWVVNMWHCVLHEDIYWAGSTLSLQSSIAASPEGPISFPEILVDDLRAFGWNDRASAVEGW
jgi:hypothetical protein